MRVILKSGHQARYSFIHKGVSYEATRTGGGNAIEIDCRTYMADCFDILEDDPKPLKRSHNETPDDISTWLCQNFADPLAESCKEIHMLRGMLHDVKSELAGKLGSALAIVELSREHQKRIETLMKAFEEGTVG